MKTQPRHKWFALPLITAHCLLITLGPALAQVPSLINYQGRLVDDGKLVSDNVPISLRLYPSETGGTAAYEDQAIVPVVDGLYSTFIGDDTRFGSLLGALTNTEVWVEVEVDGTVLSPRERLVCVAYAMVAGGVTNEAITGSMIRDKAIGAGKLEADCVDSDTIQDQSIRFADIGNNGAARGQVMKVNETGNWIPADDDDSGVTDHGALTGLAGDDHTQYYRVDGARTLAGAMNAGNNQIVNLGAATVANHALRYDQAVKPGDTAGGGLAGSYPDPSLASNSVTSLTIQDGTIRLHDINHDHAETGEVIKWSGSEWEPAPDEDTSVTDHGALTGLTDNDHPQYLRSDAADVFNEAGASIDLRFEGDTDTGLLFLDASADAIGIGDSTPQGKLQVVGDEVRIGDFGTPVHATADGDLYVEDTLEVHGPVELDGPVQASGGMTVGAAGTPFASIYELTGTTSTNEFTTLIPVSGNVRVLSASISRAPVGFLFRYYVGDPGTGFYIKYGWSQVGYSLELTHSSELLKGQDYSIIIMELP